MPSRTQKKSAIPVGTQFSPNLVNLSAFLKAITKHSGDKQSMQAAVWASPVRIKQKATTLTRRTGSLPLEAAIQYGLLDAGYRITELTRKLLDIDAEELYESFARHILLKCGGLRVLDAVEQMQIEKLSITGDSLASYLSAQGFNVSVHNTAINSLRMWLAAGGVFVSKGKGGSAWELVSGCREKLLGMSAGQINVLSTLAPHQLAFVDALCAAAAGPSYQANEIRDLAIARHPELRFDRGSLPGDVLRPLAEAGILTFKTKGTVGGKSTTFFTTELFDREILADFVNNTVKDLDAALAVYYKKRPSDIYSELRSADTGTKGRALEALAIRLMRLLGLRFVSWNNRAKDTGFAEVDAVLAGVFGAVPTRWQIQCKNTPRSRKVTVEDIAKEVGLTLITNATHVLFVAIHGFTSEARKFAQEVMDNSALTIFLIGATEFSQIERDDSCIGRILRAQAEAIVRATPRRSVFSWQ